MDGKQKAVADRIEMIEEELRIAREYLLDGSNADWRGFRPLFRDKIREGRSVPPHRDWVKNVFIPGRERALRKSELALERLERSGRAAQR